MIYYGIYKITNLLNGKMYIGKHKTTNLDDNYMGSGKHLKYALQKYGKENFRKEWIMFCEDEEEMNYMERVYVDQTWLDRSDTYNLKLGGEGGSSKNHPSRMRKRGPRSEQIKQKISNTLKGHAVSAQSRQKMSQNHKNKQWSIERKRMQSKIIKLWWSKRKYGVT